MASVYDAGRAGRPMLQIHFSNRCEALLDRLLVQLAADGSGDAFSAEQLIVPSAALRRALTLTLADRRGICANVAFSYLGPWLWRQTARLLPGRAPQPPIRPELLAWRVHTLLADPDLLGGHPRLARYLDGADAVMRFELAGRIATLFDQYATYRPDWLDAWGRGHTVELGTRNAEQQADAGWQAALWQRLAPADPVASGTAFIDALAGVSLAQARAAGLPASAHLFLPTSLPALHIAWLQQLGRLLDLHLYVLNPCQEYWFELIDRRRLGHLARRGPALHQEEGHPLLAGWGKQTQALVDALVDSAGESATDDADFRAHPGDTLLARLQNGLLALDPPAPGTLPLRADDRSVEVHVCHSLTRELEVLHDHLLGLLASGTVRHPSEVLVVTPDLAAAAPLIDAVFGTAPAERRIPYTLSGLARSSVNAPARALLGLLALAGSRFSASAVFATLQQDIVARRFGLDADALQQLHDLLRDAGVRWGLDGPHRASFDLPGSTEHTWADGLARLFLGYALPTRVAEPLAGLLPAGDCEGAEALVLGAFWHAFEQLRALHAATRQPLAPPAWRALLVDAVERFLAPVGDELDERQELLAAVRDLTDAMQQGDAGAVPLALLRVALQRQLDDPAHGGVPGGGVTFSAMGSLRGLPYPVVCVIGLDDGVFPSAQRPPEFDLMPLQPRRGDRQRRSDERNLFLDLLLAARHSLYLSHTGRSVRDNAPLPPSVLVSELLELLIPAIAEDPGSPAHLAQARRRLVVEHPLQPFAVEGFDPAGDARLRSHHRELGDALRQSLQAPKTPPAPAAPTPDDDDDEEDDADAPSGAEPAFFAAALQPPGPEWHELRLERLVEFFRNPCRYLLRRRLGLELLRAADELQDDEPFLPDGPARRALAERLLPPLLAGADGAAVRQLARAGRELPAGALGRHALERELAGLTAFAQRVAAQQAAPCLPPHPVQLSFDLDGERWQLLGSLADLRADGLLRWRCDALRPADRIEAWILHLALCAAPPPGVQAQTRWLSLDGALRLQTPARPEVLLLELLRLYRRGLCEPLPFFPKSAWAFVDQGGSLTAAARAWTPTRDRPFTEGADPAYRLALRGRGDPLAGDFADLAQRVYGPLIGASADPGD